MTDRKRLNTARVAVVLFPGARPHAHATKDAANNGLNRLAEGAQQIGSTRFVGYQEYNPTPAAIPPGSRFAIYEADYEMAD
jgi:hypothetical protein